LVKRIEALDLNFLQKVAAWFPFALQNVISNLIFHHPDERHRAPPCLVNTYCLRLILDKWLVHTLWDIWTHSCLFSAAFLEFVTNSSDIFCYEDIQAWSLDTKMYSTKAWLDCFIDGGKAIKNELSDTDVERDQH
jgi:hypothetical protein